MKTAFFKDQKQKESDLVCFINTAFSSAKSFRASKGVDSSIKIVNDYFSVNRGIVLIQGADDSCDSYENKGQPQAVKDSGISCNQIMIHMDNISNLIETWMAVVSDALLNLTKPFTIESTAKPGSSSDISEDQLVSNIREIIYDRLIPISGGDERTMKVLLSNMIVDRNNGQDLIREVRDGVLDVIKEHRQETADDTAEAIDLEMTDQIQESNYTDIARKLYYDFAKNDFAILKAPQYVFDYRDRITRTGVEEVKGEYLFLEVIDWNNYYAAPNTTIRDPGSYEFDVSSMTISELEDAKTCDGFLSKSIDDVLEFFDCCDLDWIGDGWDYTEEVEKHNAFDSIPVLKGRIKAPGWMLHKFGLDKQAEKNIEDSNITYDVVFWIIHEFIIYGSISLNRKPVTMYKVGGWLRGGDHVYDSQGITTIALPYQASIDKSYRHLLKNQEFSALGIWGYNSKKIDADDFDVKRDLVGGVAIPVKTSVQDGGNDRPIFNIRVDSNTSEILTDIAHFQQEMEEKSQISSFSVGIATRIGSSIRTTGLGSLFQSNANLQTISKITEMEARCIKPFVKDLSRIVIWTSKNPNIVGGFIDVQVLSLTDIIRRGDESQNLDFFIQNIIGIINAIAALDASGINTDGLKNLIGKYAEAKGFNADDVFGGDQASANLAGALQNVRQNNVELDGRSRPQIDVGLRI